MIPINIFYVGLQNQGVYLVTSLEQFVAGHFGVSHAGAGVVTFDSHARTYKSEQFLSVTMIFETFVSTRACKQRCSPPELSGCPVCHWTLLSDTFELSGVHH